MMADLNRHHCDCHPKNHKMATTRLRKTFHYPTDDSEDDETPADLDEEG